VAVFKEKFGVRWDKMLIWEGSKLRKKWLKLGKIGKDILRDGILGKMGKIDFERFLRLISIFDQKCVEIFRF